MLEHCTRVVDAQRERNTDKAAVKGYDAGKTASGSKCQIAVDIQLIEDDRIVTIVSGDAEHRKRSMDPALVCGVKPAVSGTVQASPTWMPQRNRADTARTHKRECSHYEGTAFRSGSCHVGPVRRLVPAHPHCCTRFWTLRPGRSSLPARRYRAGPDNARTAPHWPSRAAWPMLTFTAALTVVASFVLVNRAGFVLPSGYSAVLNATAPLFGVVAT